MDEIAFFIHCLEMIYLFACVALLSFIHPGSKLLIEGGLPAEFLCVGYVGFRLILQSGALLIRQQPLQLASQKMYFWLGLAGAGIQYFEFQAIASGAPVRLVGFLLFAYPPILLLLDWFVNHSRPSKVQAIQAIIATSGILMISLRFLGEDSHGVLFSFLSSICMAVWIFLSAQIGSRSGSLETATFFDLYALIILGLACLQTTDTQVDAFFTWIDSPGNIIALLLYSALFGTLPNLFFFKGTQTVDSLRSGLILMNEPILSTFLAFLIWQSSISWVFLLGALAILISNLPVSEIRRYFRGRKPFNFSFQNRPL